MAFPTQSSYPFNQDQRLMQHPQWVPPTAAGPFGGQAGAGLAGLGGGSSPLPWNFAPPNKGPGQPAAYQADPRSEAAAYANMGTMSDADLNTLLNHLAGGVGTSAAYFNGQPGAPGGSRQESGRSAVLGSVDPTGHGDFGQAVQNNLGLGPNSPAMRLAHAFGGRSNANARIRAFYDAQGKEYRGYEQEHQQMLDGVKQEIAKRGQMANVNANFANMQPMYQKIHDQALNSNLQQVQQQYQDMLRSGALQSASQGLSGSSVDASRRGDAATQRNAGAISAANSADNYVGGIQAQNEQQRQNLLGTIGGGNPYNGQVYDQQLRQIVNQTDQLGRQTEQQQLSNQNNIANSDNYSQALGGAMSNLGQLYSTNQTTNYYNNHSYGGGF